MPRTTDRSAAEVAGDVAVKAAAIITSPIWIWIPIGREVANVFSKKPPKDVSPVLLRYVTQMHEERCFAKHFNKYFYEKLAEIKATLKGYDHMAYNIALCGETRVGKSSLCNALLGLGDRDRGE
jgi:ABC-type transport system involved in cytochrome bd biosynthesis fused ATPase/permease subunit